jgi:hypothetical protein
MTDVMLFKTKVALTFSCCLSTFLIVLFISYTYGGEEMNRQLFRYTMTIFRIYIEEERRELEITIIEWSDFFSSSSSPLFVITT